MARPLRLERAGGLYHVTMRGDRREAIYCDDDDREAWLELLGDVCRPLSRSELGAGTEGHVCWRLAVE